MPAALAVLVADSDEQSRRQLTDLLRGARAVGTVSEAGDARRCLKLLSERTYDLLFLDVKLRGLGGRTAAEVAGMSPSRVVLLTELEIQIRDAFANSVDCMVKPIREDRLQLALVRLLGTGESGVADEAIDRSASDATPAAAGDRLAVFTDGRIRLLAINKIQLAEVEHRRVYISTPEERFPTDLTLTEIEKRYRSHGFIRVHRQYVVNIHHIDAVEPFFNNTYLLTIRQRPSLRIPVSRRRARDLRELLRL
ncbi:MAG: LytR/AlgR family response regulator transcription factor [Candidatus Dormibacteria bacterium]